MLPTIYVSKEVALIAQDHSESLENSTTEGLIRETLIKGVRRIENGTVNQIQLLFDRKLSEVVKYNLRFNFGFVWAGEQKVWQRTLNCAGTSAADKFFIWYNSV